MYDINTRINATIPYFFLGPFLLLARAGTPLAHPFVQVHARAATKIIGFGILGWIVYFFTRQYLLVGFLGITLESIVLILLMTTLI